MSRHFGEFADDEKAPIVQRGERFITESQSADSSSVRESGDSYARSRLTSHAPFQDFDEQELAAGIFFAGVMLAPLAIAFGMLFFYLALIA